MECPNCGRQMTNTTPTKGYCMKCDVLVHLPSGIAYTGDPKEDKFIGSPAVWMSQKKDGLEATLSPDALVMTWKEGKSYGHKRPTAICQTRRRKRTTIGLNRNRLSSTFSSLIPWKPCKRQSGYRPPHFRFLNNWTSSISVT